MFLYEAFGITIESEISLPELSASTSLATAIIRRGSVPINLASPSFAGVRFELAPKQFLLTVDGVARYLVKNGRTIMVDRDLGAKDDDVRAFLLLPVLGVLVLQRGILALSASTVEFGERCIAFSGRDGAGKALLAEGFRRKGHRVLSDNITAIEFDERRSPFVQPAYPVIRLWENVLVHLGDNFALYPPVRDGIRKYVKPIGPDYCNESRPLSAIYLLVRSKTPEIRIEVATASEKIYRINTDSFGYQFINGMGLVSRHSLNVLKLVSGTPIKVVFRPGHKLSVVKLLDRILEDIVHG